MSIGKEICGIWTRESLGKEEQDIYPHQPSGIQAFVETSGHRHYPVVGNTFKRSAQLRRRTSDLLEVSGIKEAICSENMYGTSMVLFQVGRQMEIFMQVGEQRE
jgi:hypothetical protein